MSGARATRACRARASTRRRAPSPQSPPRHNSPRATTSNTNTRLCELTPAITVKATLRRSLRTHTTLRARSRSPNHCLRTRYRSRARTRPRTQTRLQTRSRHAGSRHPCASARVTSAPRRRALHRRRCPLGARGATRHVPALCTARRTSRKRPRGAKPRASAT